MLPVQLANFFVSDLTWASHDSFSLIKTPRNIILETRLISVDPIIIGGFISWSLSVAQLVVLLKYIKHDFSKHGIYRKLF